MEVENILKNSKRSKNKYDYIVKSLEFYIQEQKQKKVMETIDIVLDIDKNALLRRIAIWKVQQNNVRTTEGFEAIESRIKVSEAILNAI